MYGSFIYRLVFFSSYPGFGDSDEACFAEQLLEAMNNGDETTAGNVLNNPMFKYLDNDVSRCHLQT